MNVTLNNSSMINQYRQNNYQVRPRNVQFTSAPKAAADAAEQVVTQVGKESSSFFKPFTDMYDSFTDSMAKHFTSKVIDSKPLEYISDKLKSSDRLFQHCLTVGSLITSGLYMNKTLSNDKLDKDRKQTLAVNQGLTFLVSTAGAYSLDKYLKNWWENVTAKYVGLQLEDPKFETDFKQTKSTINEINKGLKANAQADPFELLEQIKKGGKLSETSATMVDRAIKKAMDAADSKQIKSVGGVGLDKFIDKLVKDKKMPALSSELSNKIKGMGLLRTMLVFGFVYRYFVPVVVTKPANMICEKYLAHKKAKETANNNVKQA